MNLLDITEDLLALGCSLALHLMNSHSVPTELGIAHHIQVDLSGVYPTSKLTYGYTTEEPGYFGRRFIEHGEKLGRPGVFVDVGPAWRGVTVLPILAQGHTVYAIDREREELHGLAWSARNLFDRGDRQTKADCWRRKLHLVHGKLPDRLPLDDNSVDAMMLGSVLHFLSGPQIAKAMAEVYRVLRPGGRVFIEAQTPFMNGLKQFLRHRRTFIYDNGRAYPQLRVWPWQIDNTQGQQPLLGRVQYVNLFDMEIVRRVLSEAGFVVNQKDVGFFAREDYPDSKTWHTKQTDLRQRFASELSYEVRFESVGGMGVKPLRPVGEAN